jgi:hypothetical protein
MDRSRDVEIGKKATQILFLAYISGIIVAACWIGTASFRSRLFCRQSVLMPALRSWLQDRHYQLRLRTVSSRSTYLLQDQYDYPQDPHY